jgi:predicted amidophosphoribosyltransferase
VCAVCWTSVPPDFSLCFQCNAARKGFRQGLADAVVPIALAVKREQLAHELWHYKYDVDPSVRSRLTTRLGAVLWRFLGQHEKHVAEAAGVPEFGIVTTVPGTSQREGNHPLEHIVGTLVGQTKDRYEPLLALGRSEVPSSHSLTADRYTAIRQLKGGPAVLLIDDTWTTGGNAQSAALTLRSAGAAKIAILVIGRHFDRRFRDCETYYRKARSIRFTWGTCCLELGTTELLDALRSRPTGHRKSEVPVLGYFHDSSPRFRPSVGVLPRSRARSLSHVRNP